LSQQGVIVVWEWEWRDFDVVTHISDTSFGQDNDNKLDEKMETVSEEDSDETRCSTPLEHTVTFKCIGNSYDSKAIAFKCWIDEEWHRIGYIVCEALEDVHDAKTNDHITNVSFAWAKYLVSWTRSGPGYFGGINITKYGEWSSKVCACSSTR